jgi:putative phosphoesterase
MRLAILSDTHDHLKVLRSILPRLSQADAALHCGDLCSPFILRQLAEGFKGKPVHVVWGNNEGDVRLMMQIAQVMGNVTLHGPLAQITLDGVRVALNHYPEIAHGLALSGKYDLVCYGHDHKAHQEQLGSCLLLNPGELMGLYGRKTFAFYDTQTRTAEFVEVD